jgi:hypothetical protein
MFPFTSRLLWEGENNLGKYRFHVIDGNNKHSVTGKNLQY